MKYPKGQKEEPFQDVVNEIPGHAVPDVFSHEQSEHQDQAHDQDTNYKE